jgi:hypothetical protein
MAAPGCGYNPVLSSFFTQPARRPPLQAEDDPMRTRPFALLCSFAIMLGVCACGGGDGGTLVTTPSPGGIWRGTDSATNRPVSGLVDESGRFHLIRSDLVQFAGTLTTSGGTVSSTFDGYAQFGRAFADGSTHGTGTLTGTIAERTTLNLSYQFTTDDGSASSGSISLTYNPLYTVASSLSAVSGNYTDTATGVTVSVTGSGAINSQDPATFCVLSGQLSIINAQYNAYAVSFAYANCVGSSAVLNGVQFSGLASLNNAINPEQIVIGVTGASGAADLSLVVNLDHQ